jgi:hypothetical protein
MIDVCLNPYFTGELANNCSPLKLNEYLAAGKPIVSSEMPEARKFGGMVSVGESYDSRQHSWKKRFEAVNALVEGLSD